MKVLFVFSVNKDKTSGLVMNQAESVMRYDSGVEIASFTINEKGLKGYLRTLGPLRKKINAFKPDVIHAHYSLCGILSVLALKRVPIVTSLMGSDMKLSFHWRVVLFFMSFFWKAVIIKSEAMDSRHLGRKKVVIPNGVAFSKFSELSKDEAKNSLGLKKDLTYLLFFADPKRPEKNFSLAENAFRLLNDKNIELLTAYDIPHDKARLYYYAADVVVLSSLYEGSPNVIKEALVCNCPLVSTEVGDVSNLVAGVDGCFIGGWKAADFAEKIRSAVQYSKLYNRTQGRNRIVALGLDDKSIAQKIITLYKQMLELPYA